MLTSTPTKPSSKAVLLSNRNFVLLWLGHSISALGDAIFNLTLVLWAAALLAPRQPWAPLAVSAIMGAAALPFILVGPFAGVFVDRWDRRRLMLMMDILRALLVASLLPVSGIAHLPFLSGDAFSPVTQLCITCVVVFLASSCTQFFTPARVALTGDLVEEPQRAQASSLEQVTQSVAMILGPLLAAPLLFAFGMQWALLLNALSFLLSGWTVAAIRMPASARSTLPGQASDLKKEFRAGLSFSLGHRVIRALIITLFIGMLGVGAFNALYVFFFVRNLHTSASMIGLVDAIFGAGIVIGAVVTGVLARWLALERILVCAGLIAGAAFIALACSANIIVALAIIALTGVCQGGLGVALWPVMLKVTPRELVGRVAAVLNPIPTLAELLAVVLAGYLVSSVLRNWYVRFLGLSFGSLNAIFTVAGALIILAALYLLSSLD